MTQHGHANPSRWRNSQRSKAAQPFAVDSLSGDLVLTKAGSRLYDLNWDFRLDEEGLRCISWDVDVLSSEVKLGTLGNAAYDDLRRPLQEAIAARWKYGRREDGKIWHGRRALQAVDSARRFAAWAAGRGIRSVEEIDEPLFYAWLKFIETKNDNISRRSWKDQLTLAKPVLILYHMRHRISKCIGFVPYSDAAADWVKDRKEHEPIALIPKPVLDHVVGAALRYVEVYSQDILQARASLERLAREWESEFGRARPIFKHEPRECDSFEQWTARRAKFIVNSNDPPSCAAPWNESGSFLMDPDTKQPWLSHIKTMRQLQQLENSLRTAAYIVIAFQMGGRCSEITRLRKDCANIRHSVPGGRTQYRISGQVFKDTGHEPRDTEWGVLEVAILAVKVLEAMCETWRAKTGSDRLFVTQTGQRMDGGYVNVDLKVFLDRIDAPYVDGKPFPISSHMFRVALAQWLSHEPYGEIAGAIHLKQLSTKVFRGYLRDDPQFQSIFQSFTVQAMSDHLEFIMDEPVLAGRKGASISSARPPERQAELAAKVRSINFAQAGREAPSPRAMARLKHSQRPVYKTKFTMCVFKGDAAECLKGRPAAERSRPLTHRCEPLACANSAITRLQVPAYLDDYEEAAALAEDPGQSPSQRDLYRQQMGDVADLLKPFAPVLVGELVWLREKLRLSDPREASTIGTIKRSGEVQSLLERMERWGLARSPREGATCDLSKQPAESGGPERRSARKGDRSKTE